MSLRRRLTTSFAFVLAVPLLASAFVVRASVQERSAGDSRARLQAAVSTASGHYGAIQERAVSIVRQAAEEISTRRDADAVFASPESASVAASKSRRDLDLLAIVRADGGVTGMAAGEPNMLSGVQVPPFSRVVSERPNGWAVLAEVRVNVPCGRGCTRVAGSIVGGLWLDSSFIGQLHTERVALVLLVNGVPTAGTESAGDIRLRREGSLLTGTLAGREVVALRAPLVSGVPSLEVLAAGPPAPEGFVAWAIVGLFVLALVAGASLAYALARIATRPISDLAAGAREVAQGEYGRTISVRGGGEIGELAAAFNAMIAHLKTYVGELEESRDEIQRSIGRIGETLRSTHDLTKLLSVVLETAMAAVHARAAAVYLLGSTRMDLYVKVGRNLGPDAARLRIPVGEGVAGHVARERSALLVPGPQAPIGRFAGEPDAASAICVPLESEGQLIGVMALYGRTMEHPFGMRELDAIRSLAQQASVGIENVLLHQEAQRLSITDGLTGAWNYRYFQMRLAQEAERAIRFQRPFSLMLLDIDHFKAVNDTYGHQRGDSILVEVARRVVGDIRVQVDTLARYGGEEFALILPETGLEGARVVAQKILSSIASPAFGVDGEPPVAITMSIGLATFPDKGSSPQDLVLAADRAMYEAKARGRNCLVTADEVAPADDEVAPGSFPAAEAQGGTVTELRRDSTARRRRP